MERRIEQLDSLRGIAAFSVFMSHMPLIALLVPASFLQLLKALGFVNGHGAVVLFFILSGFVLSIPFYNKNEVNYFPYLIKRFFRIYVPYIIAIAFAILLSQVLINIRLNGLNEVIDSSWKTLANSKLILEHLFLIGNIHSESFNGVIWSLIHELRISLFFPFIVLIIKRLSWNVSLLICILLSMTTLLNYIFTFQKSNGFLISYFDSLHFLSIFILGAVIAKHREKIARFTIELSVLQKVGIIILSSLFYNFSGTVINSMFHIMGFKSPPEYSVIFIEYGMAIGAIGFIIISMGSNRVAKFLMLSPISFLGRISYSLYLYHLPVLLALLRIFYGKFPLWLIILFSFALSIYVSFLACRFIEEPSMRIGRRISSRVQERFKTITLITDLKR